jgi:hypothetical protein
MLVGSALCDHGLLAEKYFLLNAAVPREAYLSTHVTTDRNLVRHPDWDTYPTRLWSSDWKNLFPGDGRAGLTWQGRFSNLATKTMPHNFYSTGEEVLLAGDGSEPDGFDVVLGNSAWIMQEMSKGRATKAFVSLFATGDWASNGGWAFNPDHYTGYRPDPLNPPGGPSPDTSVITDAQLRADPFFEPFTLLKVLNGGAVPDTTNGIDLSSPQGGGHAADYSIRAWLLAHDVPAISNPAGSGQAFAIDGTSSPSEEDMNAESFKGADWGNWKHSDLKKQPMDRVGLLFDKMVTLGEFKK